ncbi:MAG: MFS transporter [Planctomycetes bacterium]|nr:MFS transporter [Planctomycetota bacterium]MCB9920282.1 MFS transporter [Planctomycetota bacterium]
MADGLARVLRALYGFSFFTYPLAAVPLLWFFYRDRGLSMREYGTLVSIGYAAMVVFELPTGWLADRIGRRLPMVLGPIFFSLGWFVTWLGTTWHVFAIGQVSMSFGHAMISGPPSALLYEHLQTRGRAEDYLREEALQWRRVILGSAIAFGIGGLIGHFVSLGAAILTTAGLCLGAVPFALAIRETERPDQPSRADDPAAQRPLLTRLGHALHHAEVLWLVATYVLLFFLLRFGFHTWQPWLAGSAGDEPLLLGVLYASFSFFSLPFVRLAPRVTRRFGDEATLVGLCVICSVSILLLSTGSSIWLVPLLYAQQVPFALHRPLAHAYANHRIDSTDRALVLSTLSFAGRLGFAAIFAIALDDDDMVRDDYASVGVVTLVCALIVWWLRPRKQPRKA